VAFRHRGAGIDPLALGRELGVRAVLAGRVVQRGEDLIVSVELVDVERQAQLWGGRYNRKTADLIALQEELTTEISEKLRLQLTGEEKKKLRKRPTQNNEAYRLLLQAQHYVYTGSPEGVPRGIALCQHVIKIDPAYAAAYATLSYGYGLMAMVGYAPAAEVYPQAKAAARRALELDDTLADAHASMAFILAQDWDFEGVERELRRSLELNPDLVLANTGSIMFNLIRGRFDDAIAAGKRAIELDPLSGVPAFLLGNAYCAARRFDAAIEYMRKGMETNLDNPRMLLTLADVYACAGQPEKAIEECDRVLARAQSQPTIRLGVAATYAKVGKIEDARRILEEAEKTWKPGSPLSVFIAAVHARLGEKDAAFDWLEKAFRDRAGFLTNLKFQLMFDGLHDDPRFDALLKRIGIPD
jgi:tetratricopeptide (TPR) repeat protein